MYASFWKGLFVFFYDVLVLQLYTTYRYGREEDEVMGVKFSKEIVLSKSQIAPEARDQEKMELTPVQEKLMRKFGQNAFPFTFHFPAASPSSVTLQPGDDDTGKPLGVEYSIKTFVGENSEDRGHKRSAVTLAIKKVRESWVFNESTVILDRTQKRVYLTARFISLIYS